MKPLRSVLDFFLYSNLFISLCAAAMTTETYLVLDSEINWLYVSFVLVSSVALYNFPVLFFSSNDVHSERSRWVNDNKKVVPVISFPAFATGGILIFFFPFRFILLFLSAGAISLAYFFPATNLRAIPVLKAVVVALVWTCVTYYFPLYLLDAGAVWRTGLLYFFFLLPLAIAFNIRDVTVDRKAGIRTLPVLLGIQMAKMICLIFLLVFAGLVFFLSLEMKQRAALLVSALVMALLILRSSESRSEYYYSLWLDGMILLQFILVVAAKY